MNSNTTHAVTAEQEKAAQVLIDAGVETLDDEIETAYELVKHLRDVVIEFAPQGDWTDTYYETILEEI